MTARSGCPERAAGTHETKPSCPRHDYEKATVYLGDSLSVAMNWFHHNRLHCQWGDA